MKAVDINVKTFNVETTKKAYTKKDTVLLDVLPIAVGARVMLIVNIDMKNGLVNGAVGSITAISSTSTAYKQPTFVAVEFDNEHVGKTAIANSRRPLLPSASRSVFLEPFKETITLTNSGIHTVPISPKNILGMYNS